MSLPEDFIQNMQPLLGNEWENFKDSLYEESTISIRINPRKRNTITESYERVQWSLYGYYLPERPAYTFDPLFHAGVYYPQEASSMFIEQVFIQYLKGKDIKVLDLCAAPGGKSTHIASLISDESLLVSNEVIRSRSRILSENITKAGYPNVMVTNNDPADFANIPAFFDVILIDAPCSGEGMFRKDRSAADEWSPANVRLCSERQRRIIADAWRALKPDGILVYSTCTFNRFENEDNIQWMKQEFKAQDLSVDIQPEWDISPSYDNDISAYHFFPHKVKGEGFFISVLRKENEELIYTKQNDKKEGKQKPGSLPKDMEGYLINPEKFQIFDKNGRWFAFPKSLYDDFNILAKQLKLVSAGIYLVEMKGKDLIPQHSLALSNSLNPEAFCRTEIDWQTAIRYLRRESISFDNLPKGFILLTYENVPLGFIKNIGSRSNNLYPNEWRIHSAQTINEAVKVL